MKRNRDRKELDEKLNAYLDNEMAEGESESFTSHLRLDVELDSQYKDYQKIDSLLHEAYDPILEEKLPRRLVNTGRQNTIYTALAASIVFFAIGTLFGWYTSVTLNGAKYTEENLLQPATFAHLIFTSDHRHPVEVTGSHNNALDHWLSNRLKTQLTSPDLTSIGYDLMGGRLLPSTQGRMAGQYMYENIKGQRITLYLRRGKWNKSTTLQFTKFNSHHVSYSVVGEMAFVVTSEEFGEEFVKSSQVIHRHLVTNWKLLSENSKSDV